MEFVALTKPKTDIKKNKMNYLYATYWSISDFIYKKKKNNTIYLFFESNFKNNKKFTHSTKYLANYSNVVAMMKN